jgi:hypothetical protein
MLNEKSVNCGFFSCFVYGGSLIFDEVSMLLNGAVKSLRQKFSVNTSLFSPPALFDKFVRAGESVVLLKTIDG